MPRILVVDDDLSLSEVLQRLLQQEGYQTAVAESGDAAMTAIRENPTDLVLLDLRLKQESGLELLPKLKAIRPEMSVIMITAVGSIEDAVEAMRLGADNFVAKPVDPPRLLTIVAKGLECGALRQKNISLESLQPIGKAETTDAMKQTAALVDAVADRDTTVLLCGETGTGKGYLAARIHQLSSRKKEPFVELNCAGLQRELTESELFGHERGAFTGAVERKIGLFEAASRGTLFLDEIGEMDVTVQAKLLKVLDEKRFRRIGSITEMTTETRVIAATHQDLSKAVSEGKFREDLFYRLSVFTIDIPPLRERKTEILPLACHFLNQFRSTKPVNGISNEAQKQLLAYNWPGNIRELRNVIERATILCPPNKHIEPQHLPRLLNQERFADPLTMEDAERQVMEKALRETDGNLHAAARQLGISRSTLYRKMKVYGLE
ncbi:MAG: DNA-binding response regulator [Acidobacteria bacterium]|nr:MAG: DNA-binding response regulator [Acidobacteriota bacterium]